MIRFYYFIRQHCRTLCNYIIKSIVLMLYGAMFDFKYVLVKYTPGITLHCIPRHAIFGYRCVHTHIFNRNNTSLGYKLKRCSKK